MISPTGFALPAEDEEEDGDSPLRNIRNSLCLFKVQAGQDTTFPVIVPPSTNVLIDASTSVRVKLIDSNIRKEEVLFCSIMVGILSYGLLI